MDKLVTFFYVIITILTVFVLRQVAKVQHGSRICHIGDIQKISRAQVS